MSTFKSSRPAVLELAGKYRKLAQEAESGKGTDGKSPEQVEEAEKLLFSEMCEICLWGNATDLSLLTSLTYEDIQKLQGADARKASQKNIIVNDMDAAFDVLRNARKTKKNQERRVDIVLDNAGFELFVDLILAGYLLSADLATTVVLHPKTIPWFVSDVIPKDFSDLLNALYDPQAFYTAPDDTGKTYEPLSDREVEEVKFLFSQWSHFHAEGKLVLRPHRFWTTPGSYWRLPTTAPELFEDLKQSELVLFKGDLNYRKLTGDVSLHPPANNKTKTILFLDLLTFLVPRLIGIQPPRSPLQLGLLVPNPVCAHLPSALARLMSSSDCPLAWTRSSDRQRTVVAIPERASGLGAVNGPSSLSATARPEQEYQSPRELEMAALLRLSLP